MQKIYKTIFQLRRATSSEWLEKNPVLRLAEPAYEIDTYKLKIGDGETPYNDLPYINDSYEPFEYIVNERTHEYFPEVGNSKTIYKAEEENSLYQWNSYESKYTLLSSTSSGENSLAGIQINGLDLEKDENKKSNIPIASGDKLGVVLSSNEDNKVSIMTDGSMKINNITIDSIKQENNEIFILNGGSATEGV